MSSGGVPSSRSRATSSASAAFASPSSSVVRFMRASCRSGCSVRIRVTRKRSSLVSVLISVSSVGSSLPNCGRRALDRTRRGRLCKPKIARRGRHHTPASSSGEADPKGLGLMRARWKTILDGAKSEALLAVDVYNRSRNERSLEAFFIHIHLAWQYMLHARFHRDRIDYRYRLDNGRFKRMDGEPMTWDLRQCAKERWKNPKDPVRQNIELTIRIRNKVEHRFQDAMALVTAGYAQALLLNFEQELVDTFGQEHSLSQELRFPVFVGTVTVDQLRHAEEARKNLPSSFIDFLRNHEEALDPAVRDDERYEFRVHLVPKVAPKTQADLAVTYVRADDLTDAQRDEFSKLGGVGTVLVHEKLRSVANADLYRPSQAAHKVEAQIPFQFNTYGDFLKAWKKLKVRPGTGASHPERTDSRYCVYDKPNNAYLYTEAFIKKLVRECSTAEGFEKFLGKKPIPKPSASTSKSA